MTVFFGALLLLMGTLVQVTWAPDVSVAGAFPNLVLLMVVGATWMRGVRAGMVAACAGGVLLDLTASGPIGPHAVALLGGAYATGFWVRNVDRDNVVYPLLATAVATAIYCATLVASDDLLGLPLPSAAVAGELTLAAAVYNAACMALAIGAISLGRRRPPQDSIV